MWIEKIKSSFHRLQWKLTLSYTAVTVGSLFVVVLMLGYLLFSKAFIPIEIYKRVVTPEEWIRVITENDAALVSSIYQQDPINTDLIASLLQEGELTITEFDLLQIGDFQIRFTTEARGSTILLDHEGILLGLNNPSLIPGAVVGQPLDRGTFPGLDEALTAALNGEVDPERIFVTLEPHERFYFAVPVYGKDEQEVLGAVIIYIDHLPTANDIPDTLMQLLGRSVLLLLISAGLVGTIFGALTARGMVTRFDRVSKATDAWSQGDFTEFIEDPVGDEISKLAVRLNHMAEQLQQFLKRSQEMAVSEERNRLARDLHDSAKQEALAASFHLGTALTLFERDPESAKSHLVEADTLVDSVRVELTDLIHELRPPSMNGARFDETLNEYIIEWAHQTGIQATLNVEGFIDLPLEIKQAIYRIMQEALANVAKHSSAKRVDARLLFRENSVEFCVNDDGVGFDTQGQHDGMGLDSMRERVESLKGDFTIQSEPGQGTKICITIPFE
ncbi:MAG: histidine kinase [Anaerolineales bacterium]|jgi:signal transduction histidine kinase